jgi:hypothetical protein
MPRFTEDARISIEISKPKLKKMVSKRKKKGIYRPSCYLPIPYLLFHDMLYNSRKIKIATGQKSHLHTGVKKNRKWASYYV